MVNYSLLHSFKRVIPAVLGSAALVLFFAVPMAGAIEGEDMMPRHQRQMETDQTQMGFEPHWYDSRAWFEKGGDLEHEADWYDYTFAYRQPAVHDAWGRHGERLPFGYFGERPLDETGLYYDQDIELNYYTTDWYNREGMLEGWL